MEALTAEQIVARAADGTYHYAPEGETRAFREYRVFTGRREQGEVVRVHKSDSRLEK